jgi:hypothetical protein
MKSEEYHFTESPNQVRWLGLLGLLLLLLSGIGLERNSAQFFYSWLVGLIFFLSIALGALFLNMVFHLTGASWSLPFRRLLENLAATQPLILLLFLPILFGLHDLYHWSHSEVAAQDHLLHMKTPFLNAPFFILRSLFYFAVWIFLSLRLRRLSLLEDGGVNRDVAGRMRRTSAYGSILFAITLTFAAFDWVMSLDAHWYSTIFGLYLFSGCVVAGLAAIILLARYLQIKGHLRQAIGREQYHDLGRLLFAFTVFWAYMAVSQYFLIWYGNIPEETIWYQHRWHGSWKAISLILVFGHFMVPFLVLLTRRAKRNLLVLAGFSGWLLVMHWIDLQWLVMPTLHKEGFQITWLDGVTLIGMAGVFIFYVGWLLEKHALAPRRAQDLQ